MCRDLGLTVSELALGGMGSIPSKMGCDDQVVVSLLLHIPGHMGGACCFLGVLVFV